MEDDEHHTYSFFPGQHLPPAGSLPLPPYVVGGDHLEPMVADNPGAAAAADTNPIKKSLDSMIDLARRMQGFVDRPPPATRTSLSQEGQARGVGPDQAGGSHSIPWMPTSSLVDLQTMGFEGAEGSSQGRLDTSTSTSSQAAGEDSGNKGPLEALRDELLGSSPALPGAGGAHHNSRPNSSSAPGDMQRVAGAC